MTVDDDLIVKYLSGEATPEEAMALIDWLEVRENKLRFDELEATWNMANPSKQFRSVKKDVAWRKVKPTRSIGFTIGIAASVGLFMVASVWMYISYNQVEIVRLETNDSTSVVKLQDESVVTVNQNTEFEYPVEFTKDTREVRLLGEAFFSIKKDDNKPFIVHAKFSNITVIGTEFNVRCYQQFVEVSVNEGVVLVVTPSDSIFLRKGSSAAFQERERTTPREMDPNTWAYASQKLVFKDTPMADVIEALEKTYSRTISVSNEDIKKCKLRATFDKDSVEKILHLISESLNLKLQQNGEVFILEGDGCP